LHLEPGPTNDLVERVLCEMGLELRDLRVKYPRDSFFSRADRRAVVLPANLGHSAAQDELAEGRRKVTLSFDLPRGAYATIVVKRITGRGES
jgi:tRNA pseudouridine13 synthase